jgi:putative membrane protein
MKGAGNGARSEAHRFAPMNDADPSDVSVRPADGAELVENAHDRRSRRAGVLLALFAVVAVVTGLGARYPADWLLENALVFLAVPLLVRGYRTRPLSDGAYACLFAFAVLHEIGAHYTYSEVPYDDWSRALLGVSLDETLGWERNHYDRLVHFLYGVLILRPAWELARSLVSGSAAWVDVFSFCLVLAMSAAYELIEAGAAFVFGGDLGMAYLGTQGDVWDAHKDMAAASAGALLALAWRATRRLRLRGLRSTPP